MKETKSLKDQYRERLKKIIGKKIETTMIYPLSQFEASFGDMWGNGLPEDQLTSQQKVMRAKWKECRNNILNNGNQQRRNAFAELDMYDVVWKRYETLLVPVDSPLLSNSEKQHE